jgi:osmotically-inducible protein OsmY
MHKKINLWEGILAVSVALALAFPAFAQMQGESSRSPSPSSPPPHGAGSMQSSEQAGKAMVDKASTEADRSLNQRIRQALSGDTALATVARNIQLETEDGEVTLHGSVTSERAKADIAAVVEQVAGVKKVENQLRTAVN